MSKEEKHLVIVGGGITGLSAAFYAHRKAQGEGLPLRITIVEKSSRLGGKINTLHKEGFVIERGPDSFLARKYPIIQLSKDLGLENELTGTNPKAKRSYILHQGKLHPMPPGLVLGIPTEISPFVKTRLISMAGKARAAMDFILPRKADGEDESLGHFLERRLGKEVLQHIAEPLLAGIYAGDTYQLSLQATFPQFQQLEQKHGSLIKGMTKNRKETSASTELPEYAKKSTFLTFKQGLTSMVAALQAALTEANVSILTESALEEIEQQGDKLVFTLQRESEAPRVIQGDAAIFTVPAFALARLFEHLPKVNSLKDIEYASVANVVLAYKGKQIKINEEGSGFVIPRTEGRFITACTWTSIKWPHTASEEDLLIRCYVGRAGDQRHKELSDEEIVSRVKQEVRDLLGITEEPTFTEVTRLDLSMPQYPVGHLQLIAEARKELEQHLPNVRMAGAAFEGVGIPDCIRQGRDTAEKLVGALFR